MSVKFSEDVIPLKDLKVNPGKVVSQTKNSNRPVLVTSRGRGVAVVQALEEYEKNEEERAFLRAVARGMIDVKEGNELPLSEVMEKLGIE